jgi:peptide/nickel transport system substrate-binding protein
MKRHAFWSWLTLGILVVLTVTQCAPTAAPVATQPPAAQEQPTSAPPPTEAPAEAVPATEVPPTEAPATEAAAENVFVFATDGVLNNLDPAMSYSGEHVVLANCYETLTFYNPPGSAELLSPKLATSWEANEDGTEWTFNLREGVNFHSGNPFNAAAVKAAIENTKAIGTGAAYMWDPVQEIEVVDDYTVKFKLSYSAPVDLMASAAYAAWMYDPAVYAEKGTEWYNEGHCSGTGPYIMDSYELNTRMIMVRNDDYWGGWREGQFDTIVFELTEDNAVLQQKIESGEAYFTWNIPPDNLSMVEANPDIVAHKTPSFQNLVGLLNTQKPPLDNKLVRQAVSYTVPYAQFVEGVLQGRGTQSHGVVPVGMWGHSDELFQYSYDLDKAKELLAQAGYPDGGLSLLYTYATGDFDQQQLGELWKAELAKVGIDLEIQGLNWDAQWELARSDIQKAQDVFVMYWWVDYVSPYSFLYSMFHSEEEILFNLGYYRNPEYDALVDEGNALSGSDRPKAEELFIQAQEILIDDAASIFFYDTTPVHLMRKEIAGYVDNPAYPHVVFVYDLTRQ